MKTERFNQTGKLFLLTLMFLVSATCAAAQIAQGGTYKLDQSVIAGGGGTSRDAGNQFSITGAIGQAIVDSSGASPFTIKSGFFTAPPILVPTAASVTVGGRVLTATGRGIRNVRITLTGADGGVRTAISSAFGYYRFTEVAAGETYIITATAKHYQFAQPTLVLSVTEEIADVNFVAVSLRGAETTGGDGN